MSTLPTPVGLGPAGASLWASVCAVHDLDAMQQVTLTEACRAKDRLDKLDMILTGDVDTWARLVHRLQTEDYDLRIDQALSQANSTANIMKQLLVSLRLPDAAGKRPQHRGARGAYKGKVSSLDAARQRASGS